MSGPQSAGPCPACQKAIPSFLGGPIALRACPHCGKNFLEPAPGAPVGARLADVMAGLAEHEVWHRPTPAFERGHQLIDRLAGTYTLLLMRIRTSGQPWPGVACFLRTETPEALAGLSQAMRALISGALVDDALPRVRTFDSDGSTPLVLADLPVGTSVALGLSSVGRLDLPTSLSLLRQTVDALSRLHAVELTANELHPATVVIRPDGRLQFLGAAAGEHLRGMPETAADPAEAAWTPPEIWHDLALRPSSDVYRAVQLFAAMLLGRPLLAEDLAAAEEGRGIVLSQPLWVRALLRAGLEPSPFLRLGSLAELRKALDTQSVPAEVLDRLSPIMETLEHMRQRTDRTRDEERAAEVPVAHVDHEAWTGLREIQERVDPQAKQQEVKRYWVERVVNLWRAFRNTATAVAGLLLLVGGIRFYYVATDRGWIGRGRTVLTFVRKTSQGLEVYRGPQGEGEFVLVPEGDVQMGATPEQTETLAVAYGAEAAHIFARETPLQTVHVPAFLIDRYDVTAERYKAFLDDVRTTGKHSRCHRSEPFGKNHTPGLAAPWAAPMSWTGGKPPEGMVLRPVVLVDWFDAYAYTHWAGFELPSESQWERAARGDDTRLFPWGDRWDTTLAISAERVAGQALPGINDWKSWIGHWGKIPLAHRYDRALAPVGTCVGGASPFGVLDMAGNVWQWTQDDFAEGAPAGSVWSITGWVRATTLKTVRGGGWGSFPLDLRVSRRGGLPAASRDLFTGMRCVIPLDSARLVGRPVAADTQ